ncbi:hypothetical protein BJ170DRAFT_400386 [Xylariales sp. AK1849]|nr:hypothetical protein BJ170DRAFT_400386 [Xylariales sp. AK1849]
MSGRSAYVRKKITETKSGDTSSLSAARGVRSPKSPDSSRSFEFGDAPTGDYSQVQGTGYGTSNARLLKFSDPGREADISHFHGPPTIFSTYSSGSQSGGSEAGRRDGSVSQLQGRPMDEFAYARVRKPTIKTEDLSGIERSGFRNAMEKRSDDVRKGISKAFGFGKKSKKVGEVETRSHSTAANHPTNEQDSYEYFGTPPLPVLNPQHSGIWDASNGLPPPPSTKLPPLPPPSVAPAIKRWVGAGRPVQRWNKLRKDPELWDPNGDVLVYLGHRGQSPRPNPSFRLSSHIIEATESRFLIQRLREGSTEEDVQMPPSPAGAPLMIPRYGASRYGHSRAGQPTPPTSDDASLAEADGRISYEMYFPTPPEFTKLEAHRHVITTRNVFALLYHASLVGLSLHQALTDLHSRLEAYMPSEADNVGTILNYLSARGIDDARNNPETAVSILAWAETPAVRWEEGWREAFLHSAGMYARLNACADFRHMTPITRALLERACLETQLRVQAAEERLADFAYGDVWPPGGPIAHSPAKAAADRLQKFFIAHCKASFGDWPPAASGARTSEGEELWLTRTLALRLQTDFGALYDYLVHRDIVWDESETRSGRKWMMVSQSGNRAFDPDTVNLPLTDLLIEWDNRLRFPHIPHPYPLVPEYIPPVSTSTSAREKLKRSEREKKKGNEDRALEHRVQLAYTEATNIYILGSDFTQSDLIDSFVKFEKSDQIGAVDPSAARRGRWVLIYAILQTLASVSVDSPNVRHKDDVAYHLSPRLKGTKIPPWKGVSAPTVEAAHERSHCWTVPRTWNSGSDNTVDHESSDPVLRMMRAQTSMFPPPPAATTSRSSQASWHTPATRSMRSSGLGDPSTIWGGSSVMSAMSDDASSVRSPASTSASGYRARSRDGSKSVQSYATFGPAVGRVEEKSNSPPDWPVRSESIRRQPSSTGGHGSGDGTSKRSPPPLTIGAAVTGNGGFLNLDESPPQRMRSPISPGGLRDRSADMMAHIIKDFDELDVIDDDDDDEP